MFDDLESRGGGYACAGCQGSGTTITGETCPMCGGRGSGGGMEAERFGPSGCANCRGSGTTLTGESCTMCGGTGRGSGPAPLSDQLEPVVRAGGWVKAFLKAVWGR